MPRRPAAIACAAVACVATALAAAPTAAAADPFGHACRIESGVRFCPTSEDSQRVPSWDGVPLDVDVTLPRFGSGPFPTIVMLHGFPGHKGSLEAVDASGRQTPGGAPVARLYHRNNVFYAQRGYAVVNYSARGFGRSCGIPDSRSGECARGWTHLFDQRFEARDTQHLLGLLVDEGIARPGGLGVTGESGGSVQALQLAFLRNRVRLPSGRLAIWRSPRGRRLLVNAARPTLAGHDVVAALLPNGRFLDFLPARVESLAPLGVPNRAFVSGLLSAAHAQQAFLAPPGADGTADLERWSERVLAGEPLGADASAIANELTIFHSASRLTGIPAPLLIQNGWSDDLFPISEGLRVYDSVRRRSPFASISLQFGDTGNPRGGAHPNQEASFNDQAAVFFDYWLRRRGRPPAPGSVVAWTQACPRDVSGGRRLYGRSWALLRPGAVRLGSAGAQTVTRDGGNPQTAQALSPSFGGSDACRPTLAEVAPGTAIAQAPTRGFTLLGRPTVRATIATTGPFGQLDSRLWDVAPNGVQQLITRGAYRLTPNQRGTVLFQLNGGAWTFAPGHTVKLELVGNEEPYLRASNGAFSVTVSNLVLELPTLDRPSRVRGIGVPILARPPAAVRR